MSDDNPFGAKSSSDYIIIIFESPYDEDKLEESKRKNGEEYGEEKVPPTFKMTPMK